MPSGYQGYSLCHHTAFCGLCCTRDSSRTCCCLHPSFIPVFHPSSHPSSVLSTLPVFHLLLPGILLPFIQPPFLPSTFIPSFLPSILWLSFRRSLFPSICHLCIHPSLPPVFHPLHQVIYPSSYSPPQSSSHQLILLAIPSVHPQSLHHAGHTAASNHPTPESLHSPLFPCSTVTNATALNRSQQKRG